MKKIILSKEAIKKLAEKFQVRKDFIQDALNLTEVPYLEESQATTIREAEEEHIEAEGCCDDVERAAFRRWIELAAKENNEMEIFRAYERIGNCEEAESEKMLAIRTIAEMHSRKE